MSVARALRGLPLSAPDIAGTELPPPPPLAVWLGVLAVVLQLTVSANLLTMLGVAYNTDGGNPLVKFHPATYLAFLALAVRLFHQGQPLRTLERLLRQFPRAAVFLAMTALCIAMVVVNIGVGGVAVYIESYFSAGVLLLVLSGSSVEQRRRLGWIMLMLFVANALLATGETLVQRTLLPVYLAHGVVYHDVVYEFRGLALYDHALTGGTMTEIGMLLLVGMKVPPRLGVLLGVPLLVGLISFGGRTSLIICVLTLLSIGGVYMVRGLLDRTLRPIVILGAIVGVVAAAALLVFLVSETSVGIRLAGKMSFSDDSTATRSVQWLVPGLMNWNELLFGMSMTQEVEYIYQLGLIYRFDIVENFWLVAFMNLGLFGFTFYLIGFFAFLSDMWRLAPLFGRAILVTTIIVASTSNSLGRKSNLLFVMTAAIVASTGFARPRAVRAYAEPMGQARDGLTRDPPIPLAPRGGAGGLRPWGPVAPSGALMPSATLTTDSPPPRRGFGGLLRDPAQPDRALRPLSLTNTRS